MDLDKPVGPGGATRNGDSLREQARALQERVKELRCLYAISKLVDRREMDLDEILQQTADIVAAAWQYPEVACARVHFGGKDFRTAGFRTGGWCQKAPILVYGAPAGAVEVCYLEPRPEADEGPFLQEERALLNAIAQRLGEIAEHKQAEQQVIAHQDRLRSLAAELLRAEEAERRRLARDLHDGIGQTLATVKLRFRMLLDRPEAAALADDLRELGALVGGALDATRTLMFDISPPVLHELGLAPALAWLAETVRAREGLVVELGVPDEVDPLSEDVREVAFRAVRELLSNVCRHAAARRATVRASRSAGALELVVTDDGTGFDPVEARRRALRGGGFGLFNLVERMEHLGGRMEIESATGRGTRATLTLPLRNDEGARS